jgi:hypothetical protein
MQNPLQETLNRIRERIARLQTAEQVLLEEMGDHAYPRRSTATSPAESNGTGRKRKTSPPKRTKAPRGARSTQVAELLFRRGPLSRREISEGSGVPYTTVFELIKNRATFVPLADGRYDLTAEAKKGMAGGH